MFGRLRNDIAMVAGIGLGLSLVALLALFLLSIDRASHLFEQAALSQSQSAVVLRLGAAARESDTEALTAAMKDYRASIAAETAILPEAERAAQTMERDDGVAFARLAALPAGAARDRALSARIAVATRREQSEAALAAERIGRTRTDAIVFGSLLTACALMCALFGAIGLHSANRRLTRAVTTRTAQIAAVDASRRLFFAKVSHELRTPVTVMRGEAEVALATARDDPPALAEALAEVVVQTDMLDRRIEELLALSRAEDGRLALAREQADLALLTDRALQRVERYARSNMVALAAPPSAQLRIDGDARWLEQAIVAVLDNAVKFSPEGGSVDVSLARESGWALLTIADRGRGASPDALPRLFDAYYQTKEGLNRGGSGLGLALTRWVVEEHGGVASAAARPGGGCAITLSLPLAEAAA